ncbi:MAG: SusC/RagA family TonB-linked outer membrane protein [Saprospiraceae bacterium]
MKSKKLTELILLALLFSWSGALAQSRVVTGTVEAEGFPLIGATVLVENTSTGTVTDIDGHFELTVGEDAQNLVFSYTGYQTQTVAIPPNLMMNVELQVSSELLEEIVVIGYGTAKKKDLTGSIVQVGAKDFQKGQISSPEQLIAGKVAGVQITPGSGAPGSGSRIRIRGGSSLNASNNPLIVIDGVPLDNNSISGVANPLALINPNDIESMNVLKDASAAAIYGARAANGVIIITTKKGSSQSKFSLGFNTQNSVAVRTGSVDVLTADEFRQVVNNYSGTIASPADRQLVGQANTNWQDEIYQSAFTTDNNLSFSGGLDWLPYRLSVGYLNQNGILKRDNLERTSIALNLSPSYFDGQLSFDINAKYANTNSFFANQGAVGAAVYFDPTQPIYSGDDNTFGGYYEWLNGDQPNFNAARNPLGLLYMREDMGSSNRFIGNVKVDYHLSFIPELGFTLNAGMDRSFGSGTVFVPAEAASQYNRGGTNNQYEQTKENKLFEFNFNYKKSLPTINSRIDLIGGYSWQDWTTDTPAFPDLRADGTEFEAAGIPGFTQNTLVSFFGRLNYALMDRYLLTFTMRRDGSSRFSPDSRWGNFPSAAFAWRLKEEPFLQNSGLFSNLKVRLGWGITGQQDGIADYGYQPNFFYGDNAAQYQFGNDFVSVVRPAGYDANLKWEETETINAGLDLGFSQDRLNMSVDYFIKNTKDLLAVVPVAGGTNFTNNLLTNVGSIRNRGLEFALNAAAIEKTDVGLDLGFNLTYIIQNEITKLQLINDPDYLGADVGNTGFNTVQKHTVGYRPNTFFVYQQVYDEDGNPIEGFYADLDGDGTLGETDKQWYKNPEPTAYLGFTGNLRIKDLNVGFVLRSNLGNYMYNAVKAGSGIYQNIFPNQGYLSNAHRDILTTNFDNRQTWSDYYLENASFLKMDNLSLSYNFGKLGNSKVNMILNANCQNVFVITKYSGIDPEISGGIDNAIYPRPRIYSLGLNLFF